MCSLIIGISLFSQDTSGCIWTALTKMAKNKVPKSKELLEQEKLEAPEAAELGAGNSHHTQIETKPHF